MTPKLIVLYVTYRYMSSFIVFWKDGCPVVLSEEVNVVKNDPLLGKEMHLGMSLYLGNGFVIFKHNYIRLKLKAMTMFLTVYFVLFMILLLFFCTATLSCVSMTKNQYVYFDLTSWQQTKIISLIFCILSYKLKNLRTKFWSQYKMFFGEWFFIGNFIVCICSNGYNSAQYLSPKYLEKYCVKTLKLYASTKCFK